MNSNRTTPFQYLERPEHCETALGVPQAAEGPPLVISRDGRLYNRASKNKLGPGSGNMGSGSELSAVVCIHCWKQIQSQESPTPSMKKITSRRWEKPKQPWLQISDYIKAFILKLGYVKFWSGFFCQNTHSRPCNLATNSYIWGKEGKKPHHTHTHTQKIIFQSRPTTAQQPWLLGDFTPSTSQAGGEQSTAGARSQHLTTAQHRWSTRGAPACYHELHTASL